MGMTMRVRWPGVAPAVYQQMLQTETFAQSTGISPKVRESLKIRASQINGCAVCLNMHIREARAAGETQQRIDCVSVWRDCPFYSDEERAALELTEAVTLITRDGVPDEVYERVRIQFDEQQFVHLLMLINQINSWNRMNIATRLAPAARAEA
jgi:AhpD family alkylhydroperoxidase